MDAAKKKNGHSDTSSDTAVSLKKGDFNTPSVIPFFQKENGGSDFSKPPLCRYGAKVGLLHDGFFLCRRAADKLL